MTTTTQQDEVLHLRSTLRHDFNGSHAFIVGDVLGEANMLVKLLNKIESYELASNDKVVFVGNYLHPTENNKNKRVFEVLEQYLSLRAGNVVFLKNKLEYLSWARPTSSIARLIMRSFKNREDGSFEPTTYNRFRRFVDQADFFFKHKNLLVVPQGVDLSIPFEEHSNRLFTFADKPMPDYEVDNWMKGTIIVHGGNIPQGDKPISVFNINHKPIDTGLLGCLVVDVENSQVRDRILVTR